MQKMSALLPAIVPPVEVRRWTLDEYHRMIEGGYLSENDDVELLEGWIVPKMPRNPPHDDSIEDINYALLAILPRSWRIRIQSAMTISSSESEPEPDLYVRAIRASRRRWHPEPAEIGMVIEVSDSTLARDRTLKLRIYAAAKIPVYWIVNLPDRMIEVYTSPGGPSKKPRYRRQRIYRNGDSVPVVIAGKVFGSIPVTAMLPA
jgi:Uma2 family endonuclease